MGNKDNRRNTGPENTVPITVLKKINETSNFYGKDKQRKDGRSPSSLRKFCK